MQIIYDIRKNTEKQTIFKVCIFYVCAGFFFVRVSNFLKAATIIFGFIFHCQKKKSNSVDKKKCKTEYTTNAKQTETQKMNSFSRCRDKYIEAVIIFPSHTLPNNIFEYGF